MTSPLLPSLPGLLTQLMSPGPEREGAEKHLTETLLETRPNDVLNGLAELAGQRGGGEGGETLRVFSLVLLRRLAFSPARAPNTSGDGGDQTLSSEAQALPHPSSGYPISPRSRTNAQANAMISEAAKNVMTNAGSQETRVVWDGVEESAKAFVLGSLLKCLADDDENQTSEGETGDSTEGFGWRREKERKAVADCVAEFARACVSRNANWPGLLPRLSSMLSSPYPAKRESSFLVLHKVHFHLQYLPPDSILGGLKDDSANVRLAALSTAIPYLRQESSNTVREDERKTLLLLPSVYEVVKSFYESQTLPRLTSSLLLVAELFSLPVPMVFQLPSNTITPSLQSFTNLFFDIATNRENLKLENRRPAVEAFASMTEAWIGEGEEEAEWTGALGGKQEADAWLDAVVKNLLGLAAEISPDEKWAAENEDDEDESISFSAEAALDRLALCFGDPVFKIVARYLGDMLAPSSQRNTKVSALSAIATIADGCANDMIEMLSWLMSLIFPAFEDSDARVRHAAIYSVAELCTDLQGNAQDQFSRPILEALLNACHRAHSRSHILTERRVELFALAAMVNFFETAPKSAVLPLIGPVLDQILQILSSDDPELKDGAINVIPMMASCVEEDFVQYHSRVTPMLVSLLREEQGNISLSLKAKAMDTATMIASNSDGTDLEGVDQLGQMLVTLHSMAVAEDDDSATRLLETSFASLARAVGPEQFRPYMPQIVPKLVEHAGIKLDVFVGPSDDTEKSEQAMTGDDWTQRDMLGKTIGLKTTYLEVKRHALRTLYDLAEAVGYELGPWIGEIVGIGSRLLRFYFDEGIREAGINLLSVLSACAIESSLPDEKKVAVSNKIIRAFSEAIGNENDQLNLITLLQGCVEPLTASTPFCTPELVETITSDLTMHLKELAVRADLRAGDSPMDNPKSRLDDEGDLENPEIIDFTLSHELGRCVRALINPNIPGVNLQPFVGFLAWVQRSEVGLQLFAIRFITDLIRLLRDQAWPMVESHLDHVFSRITDHHPITRRACCFSIGVLAESGPPYAELAKGSLPALMQVISHPCDGDRDILARDNALASVARLARSNLIDPQDPVIPRWVSALPIQQDTDELEASILFLIDLINSEHTSVSPSSSPELPHHVIQTLLLGFQNDSCPVELKEPIRAGVKTYLGKIQDPTGLLHQVPGLQSLIA